MIDYKNKRILLVAPKFGGFYKYIIAAIKDLGAKEVIFVNNRSFFLEVTSTRGDLQLLRKFYYKITSPTKRYVRKIIKSGLVDHKFDFCICIQDQCLSPLFFDYIRRVNPSISIILYLWDSISMFNCLGNQKYYDKIYTFDLEDSKKYNLNYLPNFFILKKDIDILEEKEREKIDLYFVGSQYLDRYDIISSIYSNYFDKISLFFRLYVKDKHKLHSNIIYNILNKKNKNSFYVKNYELVEKIRKDDFIIYEPIPQSELQRKLLDTKCILDIQFEYQAGISQQTMLSMALGKKVITTNEYIKYTPFYDPEWIFIINRKKPFISIDFVSREVDPSKRNWLMEYELNSWLLKLINFS